LDAVLPGTLYNRSVPFLGYDKGADGRPRIVPGQAEIIRLIYRLFVEGQTPSAIAKHLTCTGIPTPAKKTNWQASTVRSILTNEKYKGDAILQKTFCVDFLTKKMKPNEGEVPQYYVENSHPAIIAPAVFDEVQLELEPRRQCKYTYRGDCFSSHIICGKCGAFYGSKVWHSNDPYRHTVWRCNGKYRNERICITPHLTEDEIKTAFVKAINQMVSSKAEVLREYRQIIGQLTDTAALEDELAHQREEYEVVEGLLRRLIAENAHKVMDQEEYSRRKTALQERYETTQQKIAFLEKQCNEQKVHREQLGAFLDMVAERQDLLEEFDEHLWRMTVETMTIYSKEKMVFRFKGGVALKLKG